MLELLDRHPLEKITVTDICASADVNRSTFYSYYEDVGQLLLEIEDDVFAQLPVSPNSPFTCSDEKFLSTLEELFDYVQKNERLFRILILQHDNSSFNQRLVAVVMEKYRPATESPDNSFEKYGYIYCVHGVIGIIKEWIGSGFQISAHCFAKMVLEMSARVTSGNSLFQK